MRLTKKSFLLPIFRSSHSLPVRPSSPHSFHSTTDFPISYYSPTIGSVGIFTKTCIKIDLQDRTFRGFPSIQMFFNRRIHPALMHREFQIVPLEKSNQFIHNLSFSFM
ncbi:hypothetical protein V6Z12_D07G170200 [Gossypium hirsutum]